MRVKELIAELAKFDPEVEVGFLTWREFDRDDSPLGNPDRTVDYVAPEMFYDRAGRVMPVLIGINPDAKEYKRSGDDELEHLDKIKDILEEQIMEKTPVENVIDSEIDRAKGLQVSLNNKVQSTLDLAFVDLEKGGLVLGEVAKKMFGDCFRVMLVVAPRMCMNHHDLVAIALRQIYDEGSDKVIDGKRYRNMKLTLDILVQVTTIETSLRTNRDLEPHERTFHVD